MNISKPYVNLCIKTLSEVKEPCERGIFHTQFFDVTIFGESHVIVVAGEGDKQFHEGREHHIKDAVMQSNLMAAITATCD